MKNLESKQFRRFCNSTLHLKKDSNIEAKEWMEYINKRYNKNVI